MNAVQYALLGLLQETPSHGYNLFKQFHSKDGPGRVVTVKKSLLYAYCDRLRDEELVTFKKEEIDNSRNRHSIEITDRGRNEFIEWMFRPVGNVRNFRRDFLIKLYFMPSFLNEEVDRIFRQQLEECGSWIKKNQQAEDGRFAEMIQRCRRSQIDAVMKWLKQEIKELE